MLRALRRTTDPELRPLYTWLVGRGQADLQTHGLLGLAESDPEQKVDLARVAEIADPRQRVELIGAALDSDLLKPIQMSTLLEWKDLNQGVRQAIAIRLIAQGGAADPALFEPALAGDPATDSPSKLMERGIAALALAQLGDARGTATLRTIDALPATAQTHAIRMQLLSLAARHKLTANAGWAIALARDPAADPRLRESALRTALQLGAEGAQPLWRETYLAQAELAPRLRIALLGLGVATQVQPGMFGGLDTGGVQVIERLLDAGRSAAGNAPIDLRPLEQLVELGYAPGSRWLVVYAREHAGAQAPAILERVITGYTRGHPSSQSELTAIAIEAAATLAELDDPAGPETLSRLIRTADDETLRQILYTGLVRSDAKGLGPMLAALPEPTDEVSRKTFVLLRLRHGLDLSAQQWQLVNTMVALPGQADVGLRAELAWYTVKHAGKAQPVLDQIMRQAGR